MLKEAFDVKALYCHFECFHFLSYVDLSMREEEDRNIHLLIK